MPGKGKLEVRPQEARATWTLRQADIAGLPFKKQLDSDVFCLCGHSLHLQFKPRGDTAEGKCSLYLASAEGGEVTYQLSIQETSKGPSMSTFEAGVGQGYRDMGPTPTAQEFTLAVRIAVAVPGKGKLEVRPQEARATWTLRQADIAGARFMEWLVSDTFGLCGRSLSLCFYPMGLSEEGKCTLFLRSDEGGEIIYQLSIQETSKGPFKETIEAGQARGSLDMGPTPTAQEITLAVRLPVAPVAVPGKGKLAVCPQEARATWTLKQADIAGARFMEELVSDTFCLCGHSLWLEFSPMGWVTQGKCSLYLATAEVGEITYQLSVQETSKGPSTKTFKAGEHWGYGDMGPTPEAQEFTLAARITSVDKPAEERAGQWAVDLPKLRQQLGDAEKSRQDAVRAQAKEAAARQQAERAAKAAAATAKQQIKLADAAKFEAEKSRQDALRARAEEATARQQAKMAAEEATERAEKLARENAALRELLRAGEAPVVGRDQ